MRGRRCERGSERKVKPPSRGLPTDLWEMGLGGVIWVPPYSGDPSRLLLERIFSPGPYFLSRDLNRSFARDALIGVPM